MARNRTIPPILNYGGGEGDKVVIHPRLYVFGSLRKGIRAAAFGRILFIRFLSLDNAV